MGNQRLFSSQPNGSNVATSRKTLDCSLGAYSSVGWRCLLDRQTQYQTSSNRKLRLTAFHPIKKGAHVAPFCLCREYSDLVGLKSH